MSIIENDIISSIRRQIPEFSFRYTSEQISTVRDSFIEMFGPEKLKTIPDNEVLLYLFGRKSENEKSLTYMIEFDKDISGIFGGIYGGSAYKFGLHHSSDGDVWKYGTVASSAKELSSEAAGRLAVQIRDLLVKGCEIISASYIKTIDDYEILDDKLKKLIDNVIPYNLVWVHKYFLVIFSDLFSSFHSSVWQEHMLMSLGQKPSEAYYARSGQLAMIRNELKLNCHEFDSILWERFGLPRRFIRIGTSDENKNYAREWSDKSVIAIGWDELGDLDNYKGDGTSLDKSVLASALEKKFYNGNNSTSGTKANEINLFYSASDKGLEKTVFVAMAGEKLIAFIDNIGEYSYDESITPHNVRKGEWKFCFQPGDKLPFASEGKLTSCRRINREENIRFLYERYYSEAETNKEDILNSIANPPVIQPPTPHEPGSPVQVKNIAFESEEPRNLIMFGAPGTGKSYTLNERAEALVSKGGKMKRVTFHPDYTYAEFVGTYKPVPDTDANGNRTITYKYVAGPFTKMLVYAIKHPSEPALLIIEEINRANTAAVFGDIFQLLDRRADSDDSMYPIDISDDMAAYLQGCGIDEESIRIPQNMFLWATMNSADQGVFPMDTAFKRRWNFEYLDIDNKDGLISSYEYILGTEQYSRTVNWNELRKLINDKMSDEFHINEDKLIGPFFIGIDQGTESDEFIRLFKDKVLMYLYEDAVRGRRKEFFSGCGDNNNRYSAVCREFDSRGVEIFGDEIAKKFSAPAAEGNEDE